MDRPNYFSPEGAPSRAILVGLIISALKNERAIDSRHASIFGFSDFGQNLPKYKVLKQLALRNRLGFIYPAFITLAPVLTLLLSFLQWGLALSGALIPRRRVDGVGGVRIMATSPQNVSLIKEALASDVDISGAPQRVQSLSCFQMGHRLGIVAVVQCFMAHIQIIFKIIGFGRIERRDMILHARDSLFLVMLAHEFSRVSDVVITDCHYQRWSYILSHTANDFRIVQHGFLDDAISFPCTYGRVRKLYLRDESFLKQFESLYQVASSQIFFPNKPLIEAPYSKDAILVASSFPAINAELELVTDLKARGVENIIVKFHPAHIYDERKAALAAMADHVFEGDDNPACRIFVSYNSFMEFDYRQRGVSTVSILRAGGVAPACEEIVALLGEPR